jgi:hypothetical protein
VREGSGREKNTTTAAIAVAASTLPLEEGFHI